MYFLGKKQRSTFLSISICFITLFFVFQSLTIQAQDESHEEAIFAPLQTELNTTSNIQTLQGGWYPYEPYMYQLEKDGIKVLTGLDYELINAFAREAHINVEYQNFTWDIVLSKLKEGTLDFGMGALYTPERAEYAYYSIPYRFTESSLFLPRDHALDLKNKSIFQILNYFKENNLKLAVVKGYVYSDDDLNEFINNPQNNKWLVKTEGDLENLNLLINGEVNAFLADRITGTTLIWHVNPPIPIVEHRIYVKSQAHIIFSKKSVSEDVVAKFNASIRKILDSTTYQNIISWYLYPAIVFQIRDALWFRIVEMTGIIAFAISGLLIAFKERATLFGAVILAFLPSLGGGLMRDVVLNRNPVGILQSPSYLLIVVATVFIGFIVIQLLTYYRKYYEIPGEIEDAFRHHASITLTMTDAIGLAAFTVMGVMIALIAKANPLWLWGPFFAFLTGAGGGILRDMVSKTRYIESLEGEFYGELAIIWGFLLSVYILLSTNQAEPEYIEYAIIVTILGVFISRLFVHFVRIPNIRFKRII